MAHFKSCTCDISELEGFAFGLQRELPAMVAACSLPYNNGPTEGMINHLKYIKSTLYSRGTFVLLRQHVLQLSLALAT